MAIEEKLLRCDFSFSNYDKDLTMTLSLYSFYVPTIHSYVIFCIQGSLWSTDFSGLLAEI